MIKPIERQPRAGRLLGFVAAAAVASLLIMIPGVDNGSSSSADVRLEAHPAKPSTPPATSTVPPPTATVPPPAPAAIPTPVPTTIRPVPTTTRPVPAADLVPAAAVDAGPPPLELADTVAPAPFSWPRVAATPPATPLRTVQAPATGTYLGAYVNTSGSDGGGTIQQVLGDLSAFRQQMGRSPAIVSVYQPWTYPWVLNENLTEIADSYGAIPMVSWHCGDTNERIASGADDALIFRFAEQLKKYARPVLLRWFWEANLPNPNCLGTGTPAEQAAQYVAAFRRIARIFDIDGASNVAFVWSTSAAVVAAPMEMFYPGDEYVDWIGVDGYNRKQLGREAFTALFSHWYERFAGRRKPMIVTETGATTDQAEYLQGIAEVLPRDFPAIKALVYFDSVAGTDWRLSSYGGAGLTAFVGLGRNPLFAAMPDA